MQRSKSRTRILLSRVLVAIVIAMIAVTRSRWELAQPAFFNLLVSLGLGLAGMAAIGRLWCNLYIVGYKNEQLLTVGPYAACRHPLYFFSAVGGLGVTLVTGTLSYPLLFAVLFALTYYRVLRAEERYLAARHGQDWSAYAATVPRFLPSWRQARDADRRPVHLGLMRRHLKDAIWFFWGAALLILLAGLRGLGWIPTLFVLP